MCVPLTRDEGKLRTYVRCRGLVCPLLGGPCEVGSEALQMNEVDDSDSRNSINSSPFCFLLKQFLTAKQRKSKSYVVTEQHTVLNIVTLL